MKNYLNRLVALFFVASLSCTYEPEGLNFVTVPEPTVDGIDVNLNSADDTVYLFTKSSFTYRAELGNRRLVSVAGYLGESWNSYLFGSTQLVNTFTLDPDDYEPGTYTITVKTKATSGTGSLADKLEAETVELVQEWTLIVDKTAPSKINITDIYPDEGTLWIAWEKYAQKNFQEYTIEKYCFIENYGYSLCGKMIVDRQDQLRVADSAFVGGQVKYELRVKASDQISEKSEKEFTYSFDSELKWTKSGEQTANFTWRQTPFYANFKAYDFRQSFTNQDFYSTNVQDTSDTFTPYYKVFSISAPFTLTIISKGTDRRTDHKSTTTYYNGSPFHPFRTIEFNEATNRYYLTNGYAPKDTLYQVNASTGVIENKRALDGHSFTLSPDGNLMYIAKYDKIRRLDPNTLEIIAEYDLTALLNGYVQGRLEFASNDGVLIFNKGTALVLNMNTFTVMRDIAMTFSDRVTGLMPDGSKLYILGTEYERQGDTYVTGTQVVPESRLWKMRFVNADTAVALTTSSITLFNPATRSILSRQTVPGSNDWIDYDPVSKLVYAYDATTAPEQTMYTYHIRSGSEGSSKIYLPYYYDYRALNGKLICSTGYYIDFP